MVKFLGGLGDNRVKNVETPTFLPEDNIRFGVEYSPWTPDLRLLEEIIQFVPIQLSIMML